MVMPNEAPEYLQPQRQEDLSYIAPFTTVTITEQGKEALETGRVVGLDGKILDSLNQKSPQYVAYLADDTGIKDKTTLGRFVVRLARQGYVRISVSRKD